MSIEGNGKFDPKAWTPARTALWNALSGADRKELEEWVTKGNDAPVPEKWAELHVQLRGVKKQSAVPEWIAKRMREIGRTDAIIETVYGKYYQGKTA